MLIFPFIIRFAINNFNMFPIKLVFKFSSMSKYDRFAIFVVFMFINTSFRDLLVSPIYIYGRTVMTLKAINNVTFCHFSVKSLPNLITEFKLFPLTES